jgi:hypothetical protein
MFFSAKLPYSARFPHEKKHMFINVINFSIFYCIIASQFTREGKQHGKSRLSSINTTNKKTYCDGRRR